MGHYELRFLFLGVVLCLLSCLSQLGCGRAVERTAVKEGASPPKPVTTGPLTVTRQDLSMARQLKSLPASEYVLGPEDTVEISVFRQDELKMEGAISSTGRISYHLIGDIEAAGLTQFQLRDKIQQELGRFIKDPRVVVRITEHGSHKIFVLGQVNHPGVYRMKSDFSLLEGISSAGGITPDAYLGGAYVVRDGKILLVNFLELLEKGNMEENIMLLPGDLVYIPDSRDHRVFILGEVNRQRSIQVRDDLTLFEALAQAGGFTRDANKASIWVMRGNLSEPDIITIDARGMDLGANIALERGDIVYVASSTFADVEQIAVRISHILQPFYNLARSVVWGDAAADILKGGDSRFVWPEEDD